ncbi:MAG TPA: MrtC family glutamic-type intramembrane protease [Polyangiaceae bacterium]
MTSKPNGGLGAALPPLGVGVATTAVVTALSYLLPDAHQATGVGLTFLAVTYFFVLRRDTETVRRHGLALGGLFEAEPLSARRLLREGGGAFGWALGCALVVFPPFWLGWLAWWKPDGSFSAAPLLPLFEDALGQVFVIALPEEAFYRGYLQSSLDAAWRPRLKLFGASIGPSLLVTSALFALGHLATELHPNRLSVFFPALLFGWLRARTGGIGASVLLHAFSNLFASYLARSYGF